ncbi:MAG: hypothetical protein JOZ23_09105 [Mycobacterium sp.]|nr:hypothetical protein [Mycobacterium sp.]MBV9351679.1 hypothetical protein [Mycobacterium sp.]
MTTSTTGESGELPVVPVRCTLPIAPAGAVETGYRTERADEPPIAFKT